MKDEMFLKTTINIETGMISDLKRKCKEEGVSVTSVIKKSVKLYLDAMEKETFKWHTLTYQQDGPTYKKFHITLKPFEYDTYSDAKKVTRLSFSHIVALALEKYADLVLYGDLSDTYPLQSYTKHCMVINNCTYYTFSWGFSIKTVEIKLPPTVDADPDSVE
jgi:hypothetical protein